MPAENVKGLVVGVAFIVAPWLFRFSGVKAEKWSAIIIGIVGALSELTSTSPSSPMKLVPMRVHLGMDVVLGLIPALSPWLFGFCDEKLNAWLPQRQLRKPAALPVDHAPGSTGRIRPQCHQGIE